MDSTIIINILISVVWETLILLDVFLNAKKQKTAEDKVLDLVSFKSFQSLGANSLAYA